MTRKMLAAACALLALSTLASSCRQIIGIGPDSNVSDAGASEGGAAGVNASGPSLCDQYCDLESQVCTGPLGQYADRATCLAVCALLDISANGSFADANTVSCRLDRLRLAEQSTTVVRQVFCVKRDACLAGIAKLLHKAEFRAALEQAPDAETMLKIIKDQGKK